MISNFYSFSQASILGMNEDEIAVQEEDWWKDRHIYVGRFLESLNGKLSKKTLYFGRHDNAPYQAAHSEHSSTFWVTGWNTQAKSSANTSTPI
ncbi:MAG: hypothetical protein ACI395_00235 [Candidatus Cryptobacteroides sp.]